MSTLTSDQQQNNVNINQQQHFSLVWNTFPRNLSAGLYNLLTGEQLVDVTLAAEGQILRAHKLILSVCSTYFRDLFKGNTCKHPIVILKDVNYRDLSAMLHFMYQGEVNIKQEDIGSFLKVAEILKIKGLTKTNDEDEEGGDKELVDALPLIQHDRVSDNATPNQPISEALSKSWFGNNNTSCTCINQSINKNQDVSIKAYTEPKTEPSPVDMLEEEDDEEEEEDEQPLDCSSTPDPIQKQQQTTDYKPDVIRHLTPEVECIQSCRNVSSAPLAPIQQQQQQQPHRDDQIEGMDTSQILATQMIPYGSTTHCRSPVDSVGFHDTGTIRATDFSHHESTASTSSKGRRTVKGLPGSSLSLETTLRVISELGPTIRMERGKVIRMYSCPWCLRHFTRKENLKLHVRYIHGPLESLTCKLCGNKYKNSNSLRVHSYLYHNAQRNKSTTPGGKPPIVGGNV